MKAVAILGAGNVGRALGERLVEVGVPVRFGVRDPDLAGARLSGALADAPVFTPAKAAADTQVILLAVPAAAAVDVVRSLPDRAEKILVDCTNPLRWQDGPVWTPPREGSVAQALAVAFPESSIIKGFNHFGAEIQSNPTLAGGPADAFFAGDDDGAKSRVMEFATRMGFRAYDAGPLRNAAVLENLAMLWIHMAVAAGIGRDFGFRMEKQSSTTG